MTLSERHKAILDMLREAGRVDVADLSVRLKVSAVTIRKDLDLLEEKNLLYRTHGGAIMADPYIATRKVSEKGKLHPEAKHRIGLKAVELLAPQDALMIASGTTVQAFASCIGNMRMTVITSAMNGQTRYRDHTAGRYHTPFVGVGGERICRAHVGELCVQQTLFGR